MTDKIELDLDAIEQLASKATPGPWWIDSHGHCMVSQADGGHEVVFQAMDLVKPAVRHPETRNLSHWPNDWDASFIAAANPAIVLELVRRLRAAEALAASRIETIPAETQVLAIFHELRAEQASEAEEFAEAIRARCGQQALVVFFQEGASIDAMDEEQMRQAGWVRAEQRDELLAALETAEVYVQTAFSRAQLKDPQGRKLPADHPISVELAKVQAAISKAKGGAAC